MAIQLVKEFEPFYCEVSRYGSPPQFMLKAALNATPGYILRVEISYEGLFLDSTDRAFIQSCVYWGNASYFMHMDGDTVATALNKLRTDLPPISETTRAVEQCVRHYETGGEGFLMATKDIIHCRRIDLARRTPGMCCAVIGPFVFLRLNKRDGDD